MSMHLLGRFVSAVAAGHLPSRRADPNRQEDVEVTKRRTYGAVGIGLAVAALAVPLAHHFTADDSSPGPQVVDMGHVCGKNKPSVMVTVPPGGDADHINVLC